MKFKYVLAILLCLVVSLGMWLAVPSLTFRYVARQAAAQDVYAKAGQTGDMFGALTSLFTAIGTAGIVMSIIYLRDQVLEAREQTAIARASFEHEKQDRARTEQAHRAAAERLEAEKKATIAEARFFELVRIMMTHVETLQRGTLRRFAALHFSAIHTIEGQERDHIFQGSNNGDEPKKTVESIANSVGKYVIAGGDYRCAEAECFFSTLDVLVTVVTRCELQNSRVLCELLASIVGNELLTCGFVRAIGRSDCDREVRRGWKILAESTRFGAKACPTVWDDILSVATRSDASRSYPKAESGNSGPTSST